MIDTFFATKSAQTQAWTTDGIRLPVTKAKFTPMTITQIKSVEQDGYQAIQIGFGAKKMSHTSKPLQGHIKKAYTNAGTTAPRFLREIRTSEDMTIGQLITPSEALEPGDIVNVTGLSKGKGFTGVVKRWGFHGGPKTHGQSDRERAPGSIGQGTTPGRIFKGKKMAGHMGNTQTTTRNAVVLAIDEQNQEIWLKGMTPGGVNSVMTIHKVGHRTPYNLLNNPQTTSSPTSEPAPTEPQNESTPAQTAPAEPQSEPTPEPEQSETPTDVTVTEKIEPKDN